MAKIKRVLLCVSLLISLVACGQGGTSTTSDNGGPANTPGATPNDLASFNCPGGGGPSSGNLTGLGATIGQFREAHPQDPKYTSDFGATIAGGPNNGLHELSARCSAGGVIVSVDQHLSEPISDTDVKASIISLGIAPSDAQFQSARPPGTCEILDYSSASIAADPGANDTAGTFLVELTSPVSVGHWDPSNVGDLIYDLDESGGC